MLPSGLHRHGIARWELATVAILLTCWLALSTALIRRTGVTMDEPSHLLSAILYWEGNDRLLPRDMPPLIKIVGGWAAATAGFPIVEESHPVWKTRHEWMISLDMMRRMNEDRIRDAMFSARLPLLVFPVATALLLWWWGRRLYSPSTAVFAMLLFLLEPTALGHAVLFKNDHASAFGFLLFWYMAWRYWKAPAVLSAALLGLAAAVALLAKLSMLILLPIAALCIVARSRPLAYARGSVTNSEPRPLGSSHGPRRAANRNEAASGVGPASWPVVDRPGGLSHQIANTRYIHRSRQCLQGSGHASFTRFTLATHLAIATVVAYTLAIAACQFEVRWWGGFLPLPDQIAHGVGSLAGNARSDNSVYLLGHRYGGGHRAYFLIAALVKAPEVLLLLFVAGLRFAPLLAVPAAIYFAAASFSSLQFGFRLMLPCLPLVVLVCAAALEHWRSRKWLVPVVLAVLAVPLVIHYPFYLSHFNVVSGGPKHALRYLSDSNVDWGQDIRQLRHWMQVHNVHRMGVSYLGGDNPLAYLRPDQMDWIEPPFSEKGRETREFHPTPGLYAISANLITGQFFDAAHRDFYKAFRALTPIDYAGYSIYIFRVP